MGLFTKKVLEYQQKKLAEAENHLQSHKNRIKEFKAAGSDKEITNEEKMIKIWSANVEKIKKEISKVKEKK